MAGVTIRYDADASAALDGTAQLEEALDDLGGKLDEVADAGASAGDELGAGLAGAADGAETAAEGLDEVSEGSAGAGLNARSMGSVFKQALEGDLAGAARAAVPLLGALGPAGALAGVAAFAGLSLIQQAIEGASGAAEVNAEDAARWARSWIDAGGDVITSQQLVAEVRSIAEDPERYEQAKQNAEDWGVTVSLAMRAMAGDATALAAAQASLNDRSEEAARLLAEQEQQTDGNAKTAFELADAVDRGATSLEGLNAAMAAGKEIAAATSDALLAIVTGAGEASVEVDELGNKLFTLPDGTQVVVDAETGLASQNLETFKGDLDGVPETVSTRLVIDKTAAQRDLDNFIASARKARITVVADVVDRLGRRLDT